jgi:hypothetical protein
MKTRKSSHPSSTAIRLRFAFSGDGTTTSVGGASTLLGLTSITDPTDTQILLAFGQTLYEVAVAAPGRPVLLHPTFTCKT